MKKVKTENHIYYEDEATGKVLAEIVFPVLMPGIQNIEHTFVDKSLAGQGIGGKLVAEAIDTIHANGNKVKTTCSYAAHWLTKHPDVRDKN